MIIVRTLFFIATLLSFMSCKKEMKDGTPGTGSDASNVVVTTFAGTPGVGGYVDGMVKMKDMFEVLG
jgi:hypothetical protein